MPRQSSLLRSLLSNWFGAGCAALIGFFLTPFVVHSLGKERYGLLTLLISIVSQLIILDLGTRNALVKFVAQHRAAGHPEQLSRLLSSASFLLFCLSSAGLLVLLLIVPFLDLLFEISPALIQPARIVLIILAVDAAFDLLCGVFNAALAGSERYDILNGLNIARLAGYAAAVVLVLKAGWGLYGVVVAIVIFKTLQRFGLWRFAQRENPGVILSRRLVDAASIKSLVSYGAWAFILAAATRAIYQIDALIAGIFFATSAVAVYAIPSLITEQFRVFAQTAATIFTPRFSSLEASPDCGLRRSFILKWASYSQLISLAAGAPILVTGGDFIRLWMGQGFEESNTLLKILIIPFFATLPGLIFSSYLLAAAKHKLAARIQVAEAAANVILSVFFAAKLGLCGVALGTLIPSLVFSGFYLPFKACRVVEIKFTDYLQAAFVKALPLAIFQFALLWILKHTIGAGSWPQFVVNNLVGFALFSAAGFYLHLAAEDRAYVLRRLGLGRK